MGGGPRITPERFTAGRILLRFELEPGRVDDWLRADSSAGPEVRAIVYGVLRQRLALDGWIEAAGGRALADVDPPLRVALRVGAWEIAYRAARAPHAAVDQAVELCRALGATRGAALVNAVLRRVASGPVIDPWTPRHPLWIRRSAARALPEGELSNWAQADLVEPPVVLHGLDAQELADAGGVPSLVPGAVRIDAATLGRFQALRDGRAWVQDEGAAVAAFMVGAQPGNRVVDLCAAPGGKTRLLAEAVGPLGQVLAWDADETRVLRLRATAERWGWNQVRVTRRDLLRTPADADEEGRFDAVLVDAPCTGLGVVRRHPDILWSRAAGDPARFAARQQALVRAAITLLRPGGALVYAVCTWTREETTDVVDHVLRENPGVELDQNAAERWVPPAIRDGAFLRAWPHRAGTDGFFAARFIRCA